MWITLDNSAVVGDINKCINSGGKMHKDDNNDIWKSITSLIAERAKNETIKVTWTKGHAAGEDIAKGKASQEEKVGMERLTNWQRMESPATRSMAS